MIGTGPAEDILALLRDVAADPALPERAGQSARKLVDRLSNPIRVAILGHPKSGKSQLLNMIAGETIIPRDLRLPTLELVFGDEEATEYQYVDGNSESVDGIRLGGLSRKDIELIRVFAPLPVLRKISLLEVVSRGSAEDEREGVVWASERADIVLWCSQEFTLAEQWLWSAMPDRLKDHGFLVLTKADQLIRQKLLSPRIAALEDLVAEEFHSMVPVATLQGLDALTLGDEPDDTAFAKSGGRALVKSILGHVDQGRRADLDSALLFLNQVGRARKAVGDLQPQLAMPAATALPEAMAAPHAGVAAPAPAAEVTQEASPEARAAYEEVLECLKRSAEGFSDDVARDDPADVLEHCMATSGALVELVTDAPSEGRFGTVRSDILDANEVLFLMQLESGEGPAADAVTLLLQIRRSVSECLAA